MEFVVLGISTRVFFVNSESYFNVFIRPIISLWILSGEREIAIFDGYRLVGDALW